MFTGNQPQRDRDLTAFCGIGISFSISSKMLLLGAVVKVTWLWRALSLTQRESFQKNLRCALDEGFTLLGFREGCLMFNLEDPVPNMAM